jgi:RNA polymerase sigma-70 factor (ECF subfamily)
MTDSTDRYLLGAVQNGDNASFDEIVKRYLPLVYRYLLRLTQNTHLAEDLTQETFIRAWKNISRFDTAKPLKPWLMNIAHNGAIDVLRRKKVSSFSSLSEAEQFQVSNIIDRVPTPHRQAEQADTAAYVENILSALTANDREVLTLHYLEELPANEIAIILNMPLETVRTRLRRARTAFRNAGNMANEPSAGLSSVVSSNDQPAAPIQPPHTLAEDGFNP